MVEQSSITNTYTKRQWILLIILCIVTFLGAMIYSIQAPYQQRWKIKPWDYRFILGTYGLTQFLLAPIFGKYILNIGVKNTFHGGITLVGIFTMMFGFFNYIEYHYTYVNLSFLLRILQASGALAVSIATYTFVAINFRGCIGKTFGCIQASYVFGMSLGPSLFYIHGTLSFITLGLIYFIFGGFIYLYPKSTELEQLSTSSSSSSGNEQQECNNSTTNERNKFGFIDLIKIPPVTMYSCSIILSILTTQFILGSLLENNIRKLDISSTIFNVLFLAQGLTQAIFSICWGFICDRNTKPPELITLVGSILLTIASFSIGTFSYFPNIVMTTISLGGICIGCSAILVSSFLHFLKEAKNYGFPDNVYTSGLISGLFMCCISFGIFIGAIFTSILYHSDGFRISTSILSILNLVFTILLGVFIRMKKQRQNENGTDHLNNDDEETTPLLSNSQHPTTSGAVHNSTDDLIGPSGSSESESLFDRPVPISKSDVEDSSVEPQTNLESGVDGLTKKVNESVLIPNVMEQGETNVFELDGAWWNTRER